MQMPFADGTWNVEQYTESNYLTGVWKLRVVYLELREMQNNDISCVTS